MNKYNTFVFESEFVGPENPFQTEFLGVKPCAWSRSHALDDKGKLEDFIRRLSFSEVDDPVCEARELMSEMNWG